MEQQKTAASPSSKNCKAEIVVGILVALVAIAAISASQGFPSNSLETDVGPACFPIFFAVALIVLCSILIIRNALKLQTAKPKIINTPMAPRVHHGKTAAGIIASVVNLAAMVYVGYLIAGACYISFLMWLLGMRHRICNPLLAITITGVIYFAFSKALNVPLPKGSLFE